MQKKKQLTKTEQLNLFIDPLSSEINRGQEICIVTKMKNIKEWILYNKSQSLIATPACRGMPGRT